MPPKGKYWLHQSSLEHPVIPSPCPLDMLNFEINREFLNVKRDHTNFVIVMTGRPTKLEDNVKRILDEFLLKPDRICCMPYHGNTIINKLKEIKKIMEEFPDVKEYEIWDDRGPTKAKLLDDPDVNHISLFRKFFNSINSHLPEEEKIKVKINEVLPGKKK